MVMNSLNYLSIAGLTVFASYCELSSAGDWKTRYGVTAREEYSDNVCLDNGGDQDEWIATMTPSLVLSGKGGRAELDIKAAFEVNNLDDDSARCNSRSGSSDRNGTDGFNPKVDAKGRIELISDSAFIDLQAQVQQNRSDAFVGGGDSSLNRRGNNNTTYNYAVSPYVVGKVKDLAQLSLRYSYDSQSNSDNDLDDSEQQIANVTISSIAGKSPLSWLLVGNYQTVDYEKDNADDNDSQDLGSLIFRLGYRFNRKWEVYASTGEDFNDFQSSGSDIEGSRWDAGITWSPSPRTTLVVGSGDRFIGNTPFFDFNHRRKHSLLTAQYQKTVTFSRALRTDEIDLPVIDDNGDLILDVNGLPIFFSLSSTTVTRSPIVDERLSVGYRWERGRTNVVVDLTESKQTREEDEQSSTFSSASIGLSRRLSPKLTLDTRLHYQEAEVEDNSTLGNDSQEYRLYLGARRKLGTKTSLTMNYTHNDRRSDQAEDEYRENRVSLGLVMTW
ncbi:MAG: TIGR03016 family PEP-CTERM system-associated outer membrane protein [Cellvibrionaceae bacterium]